MRQACILGSILFLGVVGIAAAGQAASTAAEPETLTAWQWYQEVTWDTSRSPRLVDFVLPPAVFSRARTDLGDLRLYDSKGEVVPYALRVRRARNDQTPISAREFNRVRHPDRSLEVSLDCGESPGEHNLIRVLMSGQNVRRRLQLDGSKDDKKWSTLLEGADWMAFHAGEQRIDVHEFRYPVSRFRYLRLQVWPDRSLAEDRPELKSVTVLRSLQVPGENVTLPAALGPRQAVPAEGAPGSAWNIDLGGDHVPCEQLSFDVLEDEFVRPYQLQTAEGEERGHFVARGEWRRQRGDKHEPMLISFNEVTAHRLRLVVTDNRNSSLTLQAVRYTAPARQMIFAPPEHLALPLRLYFGNPNAGAPHYDFAATLAEDPHPSPVRAALGEDTTNPVYQPPALAWSERWPWLIYVVLSGASLVLLLLLTLLGREAIRRNDQAEQAAAQAP